jgi:hypothetical protein
MASSQPNEAQSGSAAIKDVISIPGLLRDRFSWSYGGNILRYRGVIHPLYHLEATSAGNGGLLGAWQHPWGHRWQLYFPSDGFVAMSFPVHFIGLSDPFQTVILFSALQMQNRFQDW